MAEEIIQVIYRLGGIKEARQGAEQLAVSLEKSEQAAYRAQGGLNSLSQSLMGYLGFRGLISDAREAASAILGLQQQMEDAKFAMAGLFQANAIGDLTSSTEDWTRALGMSSAMLEKMRKDARDLPGEFEDLENVFQGAIIGGGAAGQSANQIEALSARMMAVGKVLRLPSEVTGRELQMMLEGRAGAHNALWQRLKGNIGATAEEFNAFSAKEKWDRIDKAIAGYDNAVKAFAGTWSAVSSTTVDYAKNILRIGSGAAFEGLKKALQEINRYYEEHQQDINAIAKAWGTDLADAIQRGFGYAKEVLSWIVDNRREIMLAAEAFAVYKLSPFAGGGGFGGGMASRIGGVATNAFGAGALAYGAAGGGAGGTALGLLNAAAMVPGPQQLAVAGLALTADVVTLTAKYFNDKAAEREHERNRVAPFLSDSRFEISSQGGAIHEAQQAALRIETGNQLSKAVFDKMSNEDAAKVVYGKMLVDKAAQDFASKQQYLVDRNLIDEKGRFRQNEFIQSAIAGGEDDPEKIKAAVQFLTGIADVMRVAGLMHPAADPNAKPTTGKPQVNINNYNRFETQINQADNPDRVYTDVKRAVRDAQLFPKESAVAIAGILR